jgi:hypothetical protein
MNSDNLSLLGLLSNALRFDGRCLCSVEESVCGMSVAALVEGRFVSDACVGGVFASGVWVYGGFVSDVLGVEDVCVNGRFIGDVCVDVVFGSGKIISGDVFADGRLFGNVLVSSVSVDD